MRERTAQRKKGEYVPIVKPSLRKPDSELSPEMLAQRERRERKRRRAFGFFEPVTPGPRSTRKPESEIDKKALKRRQQRDAKRAAQIAAEREAFLQPKREHEASLLAKREERRARREQVTPAMNLQRTLDFINGMFPAGHARNMVTEWAKAGREPRFFRQHNQWHIQLGDRELPVDEFTQVVEREMQSQSDTQK